MVNLTGRQISTEVKEALSNSKGCPTTGWMLCEAAGSPSLEASMERLNTTCHGGLGDLPLDVGSCPVTSQIPSNFENLLFWCEKHVLESYYPRDTKLVF